MVIRRYEAGDVGAMTAIWNEVVSEGNAFPQEEGMTPEEASEFFAAQSFTGVAEQDGEVVGLYILHPNNVGHVKRLANASYAVRRGCRGHHIGEALVRDSLARGKALGFRALQFNAVVASNRAALALYERLGFQRLGVIPRIFELPDGSLEDIVLMCHPL